MYLEYFIINCVKGRTFLEVIRKKHNLKVYANNVQCKLTPHWTVVWRSYFIMIRFGSLERDYSLSKGDMTLEKALRLQHGKMFSCMIDSDHPRAVNQLSTAT